ncbi:hypothetical protein ACSNOI_06195 [Actinomadura kijaniata]|uniref:hypothetical protein n=1 Tax=Actinomadura kijaniata TaxID=46161 RepID=UPI003F1C4C4C
MKEMQDEGLIAGVSGVLGRHMVQTLLAAGHQVIGSAWAEEEISGSRRSVPSACRRT